ncbi:hypothetical protein [Microbacterium gorillae]|uniref:hypothetical protein n=1 Tax=Microbacterium gorillae TaxID=1231063 RepID=UPI0006937C16|nr:hypothetical protein [Microbacterium gorillae]
MSDLPSLLTDARSRLRDVARETLGEWRTPRRVLGFSAAPRIVSVGTAWHVGALLIGDDQVFSVGEITRAAEAVRRGYTAESARERADVRAAAVRGRIEPGTVVHLGWQVLDLSALAAGGSSGPLSLSDGVPMIQWSRTGSPTALEPYLEERIALLHGAD